MKFKALVASLTTVFAVALGSGTQAATVTAGLGGFDDGWATTITYEDDAARGVLNDRSNPLNALGAVDNKFFEIGFGSTVDLTFGTSFVSDTTIFEVTFNSVLNFPESAQLWVGNGGVFTFIQDISNNGAQKADGGVTVGLPAGQEFDTVRLVDTSPLSSTNESDSNGNPLGGFDVNAVRVTPVPLPAGGLLLLAGLGGLVAARRRQKS